MRISDVAHAAGCSVRAIRYLHTTGAVDEPKRTGANYRDYSLSDVAAILRARALVDAGVPVNQIKQPGAVGRALNLIEERIATLLSQRDRLIALSQTDVGVPADIRRDLRNIIEDGALLGQELDSLDLMALAGVATEATWEQLRRNIRDATCVTATQRCVELWWKLGETNPTHEEMETLIAELRRQLPSSLLNGIVDTLNSGNMALAPDDVDLTGAQSLALAALIGEVR